MSLLESATHALRKKFGAKWKCPECGGRLVEQPFMVDHHYSMAHFVCQQCEHDQWHTPSEKNP